MKPIIGQECICPDGLGRVIDFSFNSPFRFIDVSTYIKDRQCRWDADNVTLIPTQPSFVAALDLIEADPHYFSKRPCSTCKAISTIIGKPFGCEKL